MATKYTAAWAALAIVFALIFAPTAQAYDEGEDSDAVQVSEKKLVHCNAPLGKVLLREEPGSNTMLMQYGLPQSTIPLLRLLAQESGCFQIVDAAVFYNTPPQQFGMPPNANSAYDRPIPAEFTIRPSVTFSENRRGVGLAQIGGLFGGFGALAGSVAGSLRFKEAKAILFLVDNKTGLQLASTTGTASKTDMSIGVFGGLASGAGGWGNTPAGKVTAAAFVDAMNKLVAGMQKHSSADAL